MKKIEQKVFCKANKCLVIFIPKHGRVPLLVFRWRGQNVAGSFLLPFPELKLVDRNYEQKKSLYGLPKKGEGGR